MTDLCSPGGHPHSDRPNWRPAETVGEYLANVREGAEEFSERRMAKLLAVPRIQIQRWRSIAAIPEDLFERLLAEGKGSISTKALAGVGEWLSGARALAETSTCPNCGELLRIRPRIPQKLAAIVDAWLAEQHMSSTEEQRP